MKVVEVRSLDLRIVCFFGYEFEVVCVGDWVQRLRVAGRPTKFGRAELSRNGKADKHSSHKNWQKVSVLKIVCVCDFIT